MSVNFPVNGSNNLERATTSSTESNIQPRKEYTSSSMIPTSTNKLKQAELKGEAYSIGDEQLVKEIEQAIKAVQGKTTTLEFSIHEKTNLISVKVMDKDTGEIIREIPPEKSLDFVAKLWEMAGIFIDERR